MTASSVTGIGQGSVPYHTNQEIYNILVNAAIILANNTIVTDANFVFIQSAPASSWIVNHNLGKSVSVSVVDSAKNEVEGDVKHIDNNSVKITFSAPFSGYAYCN